MTDRNSQIEEVNMKTTVTIEWDEPKEQHWLCADNISIALHAYCKNTKFKVTDSSPAPSEKEWIDKHEHTHSLYVRCLDCFMFGTPMPHEMENFAAAASCGNCSSLRTVKYYPSCCVVNYALEQTPPPMSELERERLEEIKDRYEKWSGSPDDIHDLIKLVERLSGGLK